MDDRQQARLLEEYILSLQRDQSAQPPTGLDSEIASFIRRMVVYRPASQLDDMTRSRIWEQALSSLDEKEQAMMNQQRTMVQRNNFSITWGVLIALFLTVGLGIVMVNLNLNKHSPNNYLSVYPLVSETPIEPTLETLQTATPIQDSGILFMTVEPVMPTALFEFDPDLYATATGFVEMATQTAIFQIFDASLTLEPIVTVVMSATPPGMLNQDQAHLLNAQCQYIDLQSAECFYRMGQLFRQFDSDMYRETVLTYLGQALALEPSNLVYRYGLATALFETGACQDSYALLSDVFNGADISFINVLAQYAYHCDEVIMLPNGLVIGNVQATEDLMSMPIPLDSIDIVNVVIDEIDFGDLCRNVGSNSAQCFYLKGQFIRLVNGERHSPESVVYLSQASVLAEGDLKYRYHLALAYAEIGQCEAAMRLLLTQDIDETVMPVIAPLSEDCGDFVIANTIQFAEPDPFVMDDVFLTAIPDN
jgi:hypothetical protein